MASRLAGAEAGYGLQRAAAAIATTVVRVIRVEVRVVTKEVAAEVRSEVRVVTKEVAAEVRSEVRVDTKEVTAEAKVATRVVATEQLMDTLARGQAGAGVTLRSRRLTSLLSKRTPRFALSMAS